MPPKKRKRTATTSTTTVASKRRKTTTANKKVTSNNDVRRSTRQRKTTTSASPTRARSPKKETTKGKRNTKKTTSTSRKRTTSPAKKTKQTTRSRSKAKATTTKKTKKTKQTANSRSKSKSKSKAKTKATVTRKRKAPKKRAAKKEEVEPKQPPPKPSATMEEVLWNGWKEIFLVGTEWENMESAANGVAWDFSNLEEDLEEKYLDADKPTYFFAGTEPQMIEVNGNSTVVPIPFVVAIISDEPPPALVGVKSVMMDKEQILDMKKHFKMDWMPYYPKSTQTKNLMRLQKPKCYFLKCTQRKSVIKRMQEEIRKQYDYCNQYIYIPKKARAEFTAKTDVMFIHTFKSVGGVQVEFDWEMDEIDEYMEETTKAHNLDKAQAKTIRDMLLSAVKAQKEQNAKEKEERKTWAAQFTTEQKKAYDNMKLIKYYPCNDKPDLSNSRSTVINRYYGHATEVKPAIQQQAAW